MEYILNSNDHKVTNNCLRYDFHNPIRFINQKISLTSMIFYNYFENITDKFNMGIDYKNKLILFTFQNGSYNISDINQIVDNTIQEKLKICKYSFEICKICILSLSTGLSFINIFAIMSLIFIPIIDTIKNTSNVNHKLYETKLKKNLSKELLNYKTYTYNNSDEEQILELYNKLVYKLSVINTF